MYCRMLCAAFAALFTVGCSTATGTPAPAGSTTSSPLAQATAKADLILPQDESSPASCEPGEFADQRGICLPCKDYEGCFTKATDMRHFYEVGVNLIERYGTRTFGERVGPDKWWYVPTGVTGQEACVAAAGGLAQYNDQSYEYCPTDRSVYVGEQRMWRFYSTNGDAAPIVALAHEWGHHLQRVAGMTVRRDHRREDILAQEIQADCVAGAWAAWAKTQALLSEEDDLDDVAQLMKAIASNGPERTHGDLGERTEAFNTGFANGITACNRYVTQKPLVTSTP